MDGASKFVRGDAIAGIVIILINIIGGLLIGVVQNGMNPGQAASLFTTLDDRRRTGDASAGVSDFAGRGHVGQPQQSGEQSAQRVPAATFLASAGAGRRGRVLGHSDLHQSAANSAALRGRGLRWAWPSRSSAAKASAHAAEDKKQSEAARRSQQRVEDYLLVDPMELELGIGLIRLADPKRGGDLLERIQRVRQSLAAEIGLILPKVRVRDNMRLDQNQYRIKIADVAVAQGTLDAGVLDPGNTLAMHLSETVRRHADELLTPRRGEASARRASPHVAGGGR